ncbi:MAG UNVERIFIED_CONTAM: hypothetical protein LVT10_25090 [Anaerolineae bacterium]|jgi:hypothetical protein
MSRVTLKQLLPYAVLLSLIAVCFWPLVFTDWVFGRGDAFVSSFSPYWTVRDYLLATRATSIADTRFIHGVLGLPADAPTRATLYPPDLWLTLGFKRPQTRYAVSVLSSCGVGGLGDVSVGASGAENFR